MLGGLQNKITRYTTKLLSNFTFELNFNILTSLMSSLDVISMENAGSNRFGPTPLLFGGGLSKFTNIIISYPSRINMTARTFGSYCFKFRTYSKECIVFCCFFVSLNNFFIRYLVSIINPEGGGISLVVAFGQVVF